MSNYPLALELQLCFFIKQQASNSRQTLTLFVTKANYICHIFFSVY